MWLQGPRGPGPGAGVHAMAWRAAARGSRAAVAGGRHSRGSRRDKQESRGERSENSRQVHTACEVTGTGGGGTSPPRKTLLHPEMSRPRPPGPARAAMPPRSSRACMQPALRPPWKIVPRESRKHATVFKSLLLVTGLAPVAATGSVYKSTELCYQTSEGKHFLKFYVYFKLEPGSRDLAQ